MSFPDLRIALSAAAAAVALTAAGTAAAQSMVVRSTGPSAAKYPTGAKLKSTDRLTLVSGDKVVLIQSGKTRTLSGPGTYSASGTVQASQSMGATVTRMLARGPQMRSRGGFSRGPDAAAVADIRAPNLWLLDYRETGAFCVADPAALLLWRPDMDSDQLLRIERDGRSETVAFVSGANFRKWPADALPVQYDVDYHLSGGGLAAPVTVRFTALETVPDTVDATVETLMAKGCAPQLDRLVDALSEAEGSGG
jgi:hypothetical protein